MGVVSFSTSDFSVMAPIVIARCGDLDQNKQREKKRSIESLAKEEVGWRRQTSKSMPGRRMCTRAQTKGEDSGLPITLSPPLNPKSHSESYLPDARVPAMRSHWRTNTAMEIDGLGD